MVDLQNKIDFVVLWVDCNDHEWQKKRNQYCPGENNDVSAARYRDWDNLKYWFRGVAKYAPWVNKIHFVTDGQVPKWLDTDNPKIHVVCHEDFMPVEALPVFNSSAIEIGLNHIDGLEEQFVYFNDDMFLTRPIDPTYYFVSGLPVDMPGLTRGGKPCNGNVFAFIQYNNYRLINEFFNKESVLEEHWRKWFVPFYGKTFLRTVLNIGKRDLTGLVIPHLSVPYVKNDWDRCWKRFGSQLTSTQYHRFRCIDDYSHFFVPFLENVRRGFLREEIQRQVFFLD